MKERNPEQLPTAFADGPTYAQTRTWILNLLPARSPGCSFDEMVDRLRREIPEGCLIDQPLCLWRLKNVLLDLTKEGVACRTDRGVPPRWIRSPMN